MVPPAESPSARHAAALAVALVALGSAAGMAALWSMDVIADEGPHLSQVVLFLAGKLRLYKSLTTIPGYEVVLALATLALKLPSVSWIRAVSALLALPATIAFCLAARRLQVDRIPERALQFHFLPILFPFFFLVYTDGLSLTLFLLSFYLVLRRSTRAAAAAAAASLLVRQIHIVWVGFLVCVLYFLEHGATPTRRDVVAFARRNLGFVAIFAAFAVFLVVNRGVAVGDRSAHPLTLGLGNVYFFLYLYFILFLPRNLAQIVPALRAALADRRALAALAVGLVVFLLTFRPSHPYNQSEICARLNTVLTFSKDPVWAPAGRIPFLRNVTLAALSETWATKLFLFVPAALSGLLLWRERLAVPRALVLGFTALSLLPSWLIEQRYYVVPLALLVLTREATSRGVERATAVYGMALSALVVAGIAGRAFFL